MRIVFINTINKTMLPYIPACAITMNAVLFLKDYQIVVDSQAQLRKITNVFNKTNLTGVVNMRNQPVVLGTGLTSGCQPIENKVVRLKRLLAEAIESGLYPPGGRLPPERDLVRLYQVSRTTVRCALRELETAGVLQRKQGSGTCICRRPDHTLLRPAARPTLRVGFILRANRANNPFIQKVLEVFCASVAQSVATQIYFHNLPKPHVYRHDRLQFLIVDGGLEDGHLATIARVGIPMIIILREWKAGNYICTNNFKGGYMMMEYLARHGHRQIIGLGATPADVSTPFDEMEQRRRGAAKAAIDLGLNLVWPSGGSLQDTTSFHQLVNHLFEAGHQCTAVAAIHSHFAVQLYDVFEDNGINIPAEVSVIAYDALYYHAHLSPPLTVVRQPFEQIARQLAHIATVFTAGKPLKIRLKIPPVIIEQASVSLLAQPHMP